MKAKKQDPKAKQRPLLMRFLDIFKNVDLYGKDIKLTYEGSDSFKTHIGGFASVIVFCLILSYFILQLRVMILKNNTSFAKNSLQKDLSNDTDVHYISTGGIRFGMKIDYNGVNLLNDNTYFTYSINQVSQVYVKSGSSVTTQRTKTSINTTSCTINSFKDISQTEFDRLSISKYL